MPELDGAVLDAPVLDDLSVDQNAQIDVDSAVNDDSTVDNTVDDPKEVKGDERVMPKWLRSLKESDPEGFKDAKAKFFTLRDYDDKLKDFDLDGTKAFLEEHGGRESLSTAITELQGKAAELDAINQAIGEGKAEILDRIPGESLAKLAPAVAQKWAESDPEGWGKAMSGIMAATIQSNGVPLFLERIGMFLEFGKTDEAKQAIAQLGEWAGSFQKQAAAPVAQKQTTTAPDVTQERQQWEQEKFNTSLTDEIQSARSQMIEKSLETYTQRRPKDADAKDLAVSNVRQQVIERLSKDADFQNKLNALVARKDKDGALRLIKSRETKAIEEIAPKVGRTIFGQPAVTPKPVTPVVNKAKPAPAVMQRGDPRDAVLSRIFSR